MYEALCAASHPSYPNKFLWNHHIPSKISSLLWELWWDRAHMVDNLISRGLVIPNWCCMCMADGESLSHLFLHCSKGVALWVFFLVRFGVSWVQPATIWVIILCWLGQLSLDWNSLGKEIWSMIPVTICWAIWNERNRRIF